jgi:hypothetical protein
MGFLENKQKAKAYDEALAAQNSRSSYNKGIGEGMAALYAKQEQDRLNMLNSMRGYAGLPISQADVIADQNAALRAVNQQANTNEATMQNRPLSQDEIAYLAAKQQQANDAKMAAHERFMNSPEGLAASIGLKPNEIPVGM